MMICFPFALRTWQPNNVIEYVSHAISCWIRITLSQMDISSSQQHPFICWFLSSFISIYIIFSFFFSDPFFRNVPLYSMSCVWIVLFFSSTRCLCMNWCCSIRCIWIYDWFKLTKELFFPTIENKTHEKENDQCSQFVTSRSIKIAYKIPS